MERNIFHLGQTILTKIIKLIFTSANLLNLDTILLSKTQSDSLGIPFLNLIFQTGFFHDKHCRTISTGLPGDQVQIVLDTNTKKQKLYRSS